MALPAEVDVSWFLDGATGTIAPFRSKFPDYLRTKDPAHILFLLDGTAFNNKGQVQVYNEAHGILRMHGLLGSKTEAQAFTDPFPTTGPTLRLHSAHSPSHTPRHFANRRRRST